MSGMGMRILLLVPVMALTVGACGLFEKEEGPPLPGERIPVLQSSGRLEADQRVSDLTVELPRPVTNQDWPQTGGYAHHAMHHLELGADPRQVWTVNIGQGSSSEQRLLAQPVVAGGLIFTMDADAEVRAFSADGGGQRWVRNVLPEEEEEGDLGGGLAVDEGRLFVTTGAGQVVALRAESGEELWRADLGAPVRAAPGAAQGRVFAVTVENEMVVLNAETGERVWNYEGVRADASILGGAPPAIGEGVVIVPLSSGELIALLVENGRELWTDRLAASRLPSPVSNIADIQGSPVIDRGMVFAVSHSGRLAAIQLRSGSRAWDLDVGALQTPWVAGDYVFIVTNEGYLAAVLRDSGRVRWALRLSRYVDVEDREDPVVWAGPVLAGDRLIVAGSHGEALSVSPYTGEVLGWLPLSEGVMIAPIVANRTLYFLDEDGRLTAIR